MIIVRYCKVCGATYRDLSIEFCNVEAKRVSKYLVDQDEYKTETIEYFPVLVNAALTIEDRDT